MYRILTEDKNRDKVLAFVNQYFDGYTWYAANGAWKGETESTLVIEIEGGWPEAIGEIAHEIKTVNKQQSVLVQEIHSHPSFI